MDKASEDHVKLLFRESLNGTLKDYVQLSYCLLKHTEMEKEMKAIRQMLWGMITMQFAMLVSIIAALVKGMVK